MTAQNGSDILLYAAFFVYGLGVSMTALDISRMVILWWGCGLVLAADTVYVGRRRRQNVLARAQLQSFLPRVVL